MSGIDWQEEIRWLRLRIWGNQIIAAQPFCVIWVTAYV
jgi:hypothetical protein